MLVQTAVLKLLQKIDPTMKNMTIVAAGNVSTWASNGGDKFDAQRVVDMYNDARFALFNVLYEMYNPTTQGDKLGKYVYAAIQTASATIAAVSGGYRAIARPSGLLRLIGMIDNAGLVINVCPSSWLSTVKQGNLPSLTPSATNLLAFEMGQNFNIVGNYGSSPASIDFYGLSYWALSDVTGGSTVEIFNDMLMPILVELAAALAYGQGNQQILSLAQKLLQAKIGE